MIKLLENNIAVREYVLENYRDCSDEAIEAMLPKAYRADEELTEKVFQQTGLAKKVHQSENPYKPEEFANVR